MSAPECFMLVVRVAAGAAAALVWKGTKQQQQKPQHQKIKECCMSLPQARHHMGGVLLVEVKQGLVDCVDGQEAKKRKTHHTSKAKDKEREAFGWCTHPKRAKRKNKKRVGAYGTCGIANLLLLQLKQASKRSLAHATLYVWLLCFTRNKEDDDDKAQFLQMSAGACSFSFLLLPNPF